MNVDEILQKRAEERAAECDGMETDLLIQARLGKTPPAAPIRRSMLMQPGAMLRRQAD